MKKLELLNYGAINFDHKPYNAYVFFEGDGFECGGSCLAPKDLKVGDKVYLGKMDGICTVKSIHWKEV